MFRHALNKFTFSAKFEHVRLSFFTKIKRQTNKQTNKQNNKERKFLIVKLDHSLQPHFST